MLSMRRQGYGGITKVPLGPFGGDFYFLLEPEALKQVLLEDAEEYFPRRYSVPQHGQSAVWALPQLGCCASSGHAWRLVCLLRAPSHCLRCSSPFPRL